MPHRNIKPGSAVDRRYELKREIDRGGVCVVFEAEHLVTGRAVAIKLLRDEYIGNPEAQLRLLREARALTRVRHPNVVLALDAGTCDENGPYLAMELVEGRTVAGILAARERLPVADAISVALGVCEALAHAHDLGVTHRDIKPANVFVAKSEVGGELAKVFDFGVASLEQAPASAKLTQQGAVLGTPEYMAPEQLLGAPDIGPAADQYGIAALLYECLMGRAPFEGSYGEILLAAQTGSPPKLAGVAGLAPKVAAVVERALSRAPAERFASVREFAAELSAAAGLTSSRSSLLGLVREGAAAPTQAASGSSTRETVHDIPGRARRRFPRAPYVTPVRLIQGDGSPVDGRTEDVSVAGMLLICDHSSDDEQVQVRFALPISGRIVTTHAAARWVRRARGAAMGLEFLDLDAESRAEIERYVSAMGGAP